VLEVDHVNHNGAYERKTQSRSSMLKQIELGGTSGYQALCRNCNYLKYLEFAEATNYKVRTKPKSESTLLLYL